MDHVKFLLKMDANGEECDILRSEKDLLGFKRTYYVSHIVMEGNDLDKQDFCAQLLTELKYM